ncbi:hypothetical protein [uncultured Methylobacterium sp.]|nr:hypothetical protein [uncultured Methylobacterium sp.]
MRDLLNPVTALVLGTLVILATVAGVASKRASQPTPLSGPLHLIPARR